MRAVATITAPSVEPVTLALAKEHTVLPAGNADDELLSLYLAAARERAEAYTGRRFITQTIEVRFDAFPAGRWLHLHVGPIQSISSVKYDDTDGAEQTLATSEYSADTLSPGGRILAVEDWPDTFDDGAHPVRVRLVAGYGDAPGDVPASIRHAILRMTAESFENRQETAIGTIVARMPQDAEYLLDPYRINLLAD